MTFIVGLTGGIGSGKTVVSDHFSALGVPVIDTDVIARIVVEPGQPALKKLVNSFGADILHKDGKLNRDVMRELAFATKDSKAILDAITHPAIWQETLKQTESVTLPYCIVVVPLLRPNSAYESFMQRILVVTAAHQTKIDRVKLRSNLSAKQVEKIMSTQLSDVEREQLADDVISNDGTIVEAQAATEQLHSLYMKLSLEYVNN